MTYGEVCQHESVPHTSELLQVYEDFHHSKYPLKEICLLSSKYFITTYTTSMVHAIDGLGRGLIMMPAIGNLMLKLYDEGVGESYSQCVMPMAELRDAMEAEIRSWGRKD